MQAKFSIKAQKTPHIRTCKNQVLQKNLRLCYSAILKVKLHCSSIVIKKKKNLLSPKFLSPLSHYLCSPLSRPSLFLICSLLSSDPNTILLPTLTSQWFIFFCGLRSGSCLVFQVFFFFFLGDAVILANDGLIWVDQRWRKR